MSLSQHSMKVNEAEEDTVLLQFASGLQSYSESETEDSEAWESDSETDESESSDEESEEDEDSHLLIEEELPEGWQVHFDNVTYHRPYYFNYNTGVSQWEHPTYVPLGPRRRSSFNTSSIDSITVTDSDSRIKITNNNDAYPEEDEQLYESDESIEEEPIDEIKAVNIYAAFSLFHIVCVEGPAATIEGLSKGIAYILLGLCVAFGAVFSKLLSPLLISSNTVNMNRVSKRLLRDGAGFMGATLTLALPFGAVFVYRDFWRAWNDGRLLTSTREDWKVCCIPTFVGNVDPRRFFVFTKGHGSFSKNISDTGKGYFPVICEQTARK